MIAGSKRHSGNQINNLKRLFLAEEKSSLRLATTQSTANQSLIRVSLFPITFEQGWDRSPKTGMLGVSDDQTPGLHLTTLEIELVCRVGDFATFLGKKGT